MQHNNFGSIFKKNNETVKPGIPFTPPPAPPRLKIQTIASLQVSYFQREQACVEFHRLDPDYEVFRLQLHLFLVTYAEVLFQLTGLEEACQLVAYLDSMIPFMLQKETSMEKRINILGENLELLLCDNNHAAVSNKVTTLLQVTLPLGTMSTEFLFSASEPEYYLPSAILLCLQDLLYSVNDRQLNQVFSALQAMHTFYQTVKNYTVPDARREAPAYALRSVL
ncbi:MAG: hypothetical protein LLG09_03670 [Negativicutes bacterium]|nr:hypothetical protein [Negativicutes bacterium]